MSVKKHEEISKTLWNGIVRLQRKARMTLALKGEQPDAAGGGISFGEGLALHLLSAHVETNVRDLAKSLKLERSWVSRIITSLEEKGAIGSRPDEKDKRQKRISLTEKGLSLLKNLNDFRRDLMDGLLQNLDNGEVTQLSAHLHILSSAFGIPDNPPALDPHPVDFELARLSCAIGVAGNNFMDTGVNVTQYHALMILAEDSLAGEMNISELHAKLPIDMSSLSRTVDNFVKKNLVRKIKAENDKRSVLISLTKEGEKFYQQAKAAAEDNVAEAIVELQVSKMNSLGKLLEKAAQDIPERSVQYEASKLNLSIVRQEDKKEYERINKLFKSHASCKAGSAVTLFRIDAENETKGAIQLVLDAKKKEILQLNFSAEQLPPSDYVELMRNAVKIVR